VPLINREHLLAALREVRRTYTHGHTGTQTHTQAHRRTCTERGRPARGTTHIYTQKHTDARTRTERVALARTHARMALRGSLSPSLTQALVCVAVCVRLGCAHGRPRRVRPAASVLPLWRRTRPRGGPPRSHQVRSCPCACVCARVCPVRVRLCACLCMCMCVLVCLPVPSLTHARVGLWRACRASCWRLSRTGRPMATSSSILSSRRSLRQTTILDGPPLVPPPTEALTRTCPCT
jgi:hypothetical protein